MKKMTDFLVCVPKMDKDTSLYPWSEKKVQVFVQQNLVLRVSSTEVLEKRMCQGHDLIHLLIALWNIGTIEENEKSFRESGNTEKQKLAVWAFSHLLVGDLQQVQHDSVGPHVFQQPLLLHTTLLTGITQLTEPK